MKVYMDKITKPLWKDRYIEDPGSYQAMMGCPPPESEAIVRVNIDGRDRDCWRKMAGYVGAWDRQHVMTERTELELSLDVDLSDLQWFVDDFYARSFDMSNAMTRAAMVAQDIESCPRQDSVSMLKSVFKMIEPLWAAAGVAAPQLLTTDSMNVEDQEEENVEKHKADNALGTHLGIELGAYIPVTSSDPRPLPDNGFRTWKIGMTQINTHTKRKLMDVDSRWMEINDDLKVQDDDDDGRPHKRPKTAEEQAKEFIADCHVLWIKRMELFKSYDCKEKVEMTNKGEMRPVYFGRKIKSAQTKAKDILRDNELHDFWDARNIDWSYAQKAMMVFKSIWKEGEFRKRVAKD